VVEDVTVGSEGEVIVAVRPCWRERDRCGRCRRRGRFEGQEAHRVDLGYLMWDDDGDWHLATPDGRRLFTEEDDDSKLALVVSDALTRSGFERVPPEDIRRYRLGLVPVDGNEMRDVVLRLALRLADELHAIDCQTA
jgi:hypothetical protein